MVDNTLIKGIEQGRATFAYDCALEGSQLPEKAKEYRQYVKRIPMLIKTNGLGATLAFINSKSKKDEAYQLIYSQLTIWLKDEPKNLLGYNGNEDLCKYIVSIDSSQYRAATIEILALLNWLRRFAEGLIKEN